MLLTMAIYIAVLLLVSFVTYIRAVQLTGAIADLDQTIEQSVLMFRHSLTQQGRVLVAVLPSSSLRLYQQSFYPAFADLSELQMKNLWLTRFVMDRRVPVIRFEGMMRSSNTLNELLTFLAQRPTFKDEHFAGLNVQEATFSTLPNEYRQKIAALQLPVFYRFIAQTTVLNAEKTP